MNSFLIMERVVQWLYFCSQNLYSMLFLEFAVLNLVAFVNLGPDQGL